MSNSSTVQHFRRQHPSGDGLFNIAIITQNARSFVLWQDVKLVVENAQYVRNQDTGTIIPFMKDENHNVLIPQRIEYQQGVILNVVEHDPARRTISSILSSPTSAGSSSNSTGLNLTPNSLNARSTQSFETKQLRNFVKHNDGMFDEDKRIIGIKIRSSFLAKTFYQALVDAGNIQELDIKLEWDVYKDDLKEFSKAMIDSKITNLTIDGGDFSSGGPLLDLFNSYERFDPLVDLLLNGHLKRMDLKNFAQARFFEGLSAEMFLKCQSSVLPLLSVHPAKVSQGHPPTLKDFPLTNADVTKNIAIDGYEF
ncbi:hypothetical protein BGX28_002389 [Mortierella sp. GBA30]|nr:hypothetical protein BGX28_002389 [Mortierella sp. GBA30]